MAFPTYLENRTDIVAIQIILQNKDRFVSFLIGIKDRFWTICRIATDNIDGELYVGSTYVNVLKLDGTNSNSAPLIMLDLLPIINDYFCLPDLYSGEYIVCYSNKEIDKFLLSQKRDEFGYVLIKSFYDSSPTFLKAHNVEFLESLIPGISPLFER